MNDQTNPADNIGSGGTNDDLLDTSPGMSAVDRTVKEILNDKPRRETNTVEHVPMYVAIQNLKRWCDDL